jgi:hypothetical protein
MKINKYIPIFFAIGLPYFSFEFIYKSFFNLYFFCLTHTVNIKGVVNNIVKNENTQGGHSIEYFFSYSINRVQYSKHELLLNPIENIKIGDSVLIKYSSLNYSYVTLDLSNSHFYNNCLLSIIIILIEIVLVRQTLFFLFKKKQILIEDA